MIVLAAHGTRDPAGAAVIEELASQVREHGIDVRVAYADVRAQDVTTVLKSLPARLGPVTVVPAFLASGYHVRVDIPAQVKASGRHDVVVTHPFGPAPELLDAAVDRLHAAGYREGDHVLLAAAGSRDARALSDVDRAARGLERRLGTPVRVGFAATASPSVAELVKQARGRVAVASWLLAPGLFHRRVTESGAEVCAAPLGAHPRVVDLILRRATEFQAESFAA